MFALFLVSVVAEERRPVRWGILGTGSIASDFGRVLTSMRGDAEVVAVGSRSGDRAAAFAAELGLVGACAHGSYEALVADPAVDVVYVATPSTRHVSDSLLCLRAGKAVLCEKSMAPTAAEAAEVLALARERGLFFLHGVWSRFFPAMRALRELLSSGALLDAPEPIPTYLRHSSDTLLRHSSETPPTLLRDSSDTPPRHLRHTSETPPTHLRDSSEPRRQAPSET